MDTSWMSDVEATSGSNQAIGKCCVFLVYPLPFLRFVFHFFVTFFVVSFLVIRFIPSGLCLLRVG